MAPSLDELPVELLERVVDYLPHPETLLYLRLVSPALNAKVSRRFYKSYFTFSSWKLKSSSSRGIVHFSHCPEVIAHLTNVVLTAPCVIHGVHDNIWMAKAIEPAKIARALSLMTQVNCLTLIHFGGSHNHKNTSDFFKPFTSSLYLPRLKSLDFTHTDIEPVDAIQLLSKHQQTITSLGLDNVDLLPKPGKKFFADETPWFDLLYSLKDFKNQCSVSIDWAMQDGHEASLVPPYDLYWEDDRQVCGLQVNLAPNDPEDEEFTGEDHVVVEIEGCKHWWDGVRRLAACNIASIINTPEPEECADRLHPGHRGVNYWDEKIEECLKVKAKLAAKRNKEAAVGLRKQKESQAGSALMHRWLKK